jgi:hypothetical protein
VAELHAHVSGGHTAFFLGAWRKTGWWYFFPIIFLLKTPLPFILLSSAGGFFLALRARARQDRLAFAPFLFALTILATALFSRINIGLRHILAVYPLLAIAAGYGARELWRRRGNRAVWRIACAACGLGLLASSVLAHPDYLTYFNILASSRPERIEIVSDLDWGQDLDRLARWLRANPAPGLWLSYFGTADPTAAGLPPFRELEPYDRVSGWVAISAYNRALPAPFTAVQTPDRATFYAIPSNFESVRHREGPFAWIADYRPVAKIGSSIFVYHIAPGGDRL